MLCFGRCIGRYRCNRKTTGGYKLKGKTLARGEEKFQKLLEEDDELRRKLLRKAGVNTIGTTKSN